MSTSDKKIKILYVEDDAHMRAFLLAQLKARGFQAQSVRDRDQAIDQVALFQPHLVLLDLTLPDLDGFTFLQQLREWSSMPVIVLSEHDEELLKIKAFDLGADDYVTKPFNLNELLARVGVALRRAYETTHLRNTAGSDMQPSSYHCGGENGLIVDFAHRVVRSGGQIVHLTPTEYHLLCELTRNAGKVLTHRELLQRVWGPDDNADNSSLRTFIRHLRRKLEPHPAQPRFLLNELGVGYFVPASDVNEV
ncbi:MAG: response regulator [Chloroflexi bacterium]|nr:response regulator [Ktedonobacteraceae bacterium]MBV9707465.1 response regulator [Chloroflexota bacterium]